MPIKNVFISGFLACSLMVAACNTSTSSNTYVYSGFKSKKKLTVERLLAAESGAWDMIEVEDKRKVEISPLQEHMKARKRVDHGKTQTALYTTHYNPHSSNMNFRTLQVIAPAAGEEETVLAYAGRIPGHKPDFKKEDRQEISVASVAPAPKPKTEKTARAVKGGGKDGLKIARVRFGEHPDKTRMVIDLTGKAAFSRKFDEAKEQLAIQMPGVAWDAGLEAKIMKHPLILGYRAQSDENGTRLTLKFVRPAKIVWATTFPPDKGKGHRLIFDFVPLGVES